MRSYTFAVHWSERDREYVGTCVEFPSLSWLAETEHGARLGIEEAVASTVAEMRAAGEQPPEPTGGYACPT